MRKFTFYGNVYENRRDKMNTDSNTTRPIMFEEDSFDLAAHKKAADSITREKNRVSRIKRQVKIGKFFMAVAALIIFVVIYYIAVVTGTINIF